MNRILALEDPRWDEFEGGDSSDGGTVEFLRRLADDASFETWRRPWGYHEGEAGPTALLAVPHIVELASGLTAPERLHHLTWAGVVAQATYEGPPLSDELEQGYRDALLQAGDLLLADLDSQTGYQAGELVTLLSALAAVCGHPWLHAGLESLSVSCRECREELELDPTYSGAQPGPVEHVSARELSKASAADLCRHLAARASQAGHPGLAASVLHAASLQCACPSQFGGP